MYVREHKYRGYIEFPKYTVTKTEEIETNEPRNVMKMRNDKDIIFLVQSSLIFLFKKKIIICLKANMI